MRVERNLVHPNGLNSIGATIMLSLDTPKGSNLLAYEIGCEIDRHKVTGHNQLSIKCRPHLKLRGGRVALRGGGVESDR